MNSHSNEELHRFIGSWYGNSPHAAKVHQAVTQLNTERAANFRKQLSELTKEFGDLDEVIDRLVRNRPVTTILTQRKEPIWHRLLGPTSGTEQPVALPRDVLRALQSIPERLALSLAQTLSITAREALAASRRAPVPAVGDAEWKRMQVPLEKYFRTFLDLPDALLSPWVQATLSVHRRRDRLRFVLNSPPSHYALAISVANREPFELDRLRVVAEIEFSSATSVADLHMAIIPFRRETPGD